MYELGLTLPWFAAAFSLVLVVFLLAGGKKDPLKRRLESLGGNRGLGRPVAADVAARGGKIVENPVDKWAQRRMAKDEKKATMKDRMAQAGIYNSAATNLFVLIRVLMALGPAVLGYLAARAGMISFTLGIALGGMAGLAGTLAPTIWLDHVKRLRQTKIRRSLPDALDVLVVCLEGGLSLNGSFARVARELAGAHPLLAVELQIVQRQTQMGRSTGQAVRDFAKRFDLEELRSMASVIIQSEKIGSSVVSALTVYAETLRVKRFQRAEELAQKAVIKILFPTLLCIFPGIFIVILGPAAIQVYEVFSSGALGN